MDDDKLDDEDDEDEDGAYDNILRRLCSLCYNKFLPQVLSTAQNFGVGLELLVGNEPRVLKLTDDGRRVYDATYRNNKADEEDNAKDD